LDNTAGLFDLLLCQLGDVSRLDDDWDFGKAALAEDLGVAEAEEVDDWSGIILLLLEVLLALLFWQEAPKL
jgi:hypothetical protein